MKIEPRHDKKLPAYAVGVTVLAAAALLTGCPGSSVRLAGDTTTCTTSDIETEVRLEGEITEVPPETVGPYDNGKVVDPELITDGVLPNEPVDEVILDGDVAVDQICETDEDDFVLDGGVAIDEVKDYSDDDDDDDTRLDGAAVIAEP